MPGAVIRNPTPDWLKPENASVLDSPVTKALRTLAHLIGADDPQSQVLGLMTPLAPEGQAMASKPVQKALKTLADLGERVGIKAYHGSPHDFDQFSLSKIGTGEGAQAYGHGLYFAEDQKVANTYRGKVSAMQGGKPTVDGRPINWDDPREGAAFELWRHNGDRQAAADFAERTLKKGSSVPEILRSGEPLPNVLPPGRMYEVRINADPEQLLDWDRSLREQVPAVQERVRDVLDAKYGKGTFDTMAANGADPEDLVSNFDDLAAGGMEKMLHQGGIPGVKYLDGYSRGTRTGTRNYVIFDDSLIDILKKYGVALPVIEGLRRKAAGNGGRLSSDDINGVF